MSFIQIRISEEEKEKAKEVFGTMGLTLSGAIKLFIRKSIQAEKLPFEVTAEKIDLPKKKVVIKKEVPQKEVKQRNFSNFVRKEF